MSLRRRRPWASARRAPFAPVFANVARVTAEAGGYHAAALGDLGAPGASAHHAFDQRRRARRRARRHRVAIARRVVPRCSRPALPRQRPRRTGSRPAAQRSPARARIRVAHFAGRARPDVVSASGRAGASIGRCSRLSGRGPLVLQGHGVRRALARDVRRRAEARAVRPAGDARDARLAGDRRRRGQGRLRRRRRGGRRSSAATCASSGWRRTIPGSR